MFKALQPPSPPHARLAGLLFLLALSSATLAPAAAPPIQIIRPLADLTLPTNATARFQIQYQSQSPVTIRWQHETNTLPNQTNTTLTIPNIQPEDIGQYSVILSNSTAASTNSAILDIDVPYPTPHFTSATYLPVPQDPRLPYPPIIPVCTFKDGSFLAVQEAGQLIGDLGNYYRSVFAFPPSASPVLWTASVGGSFSGRSWTQTISDTSFVSFTGVVNGNVGHQTGASFFLFGSPYGMTTNSYREFPNSGGFALGKNHTIQVLCGNAKNAFILNSTGGVVFSKPLPLLPSFYTAGRYFMAWMGNTNFVPEFGRALSASNNWFCGAYSLNGDLEWVAETTNSFSTLLSGEFELDHFILNGLLKIDSSGAKVWAISGGSDLDFRLNRLGHLVCCQEHGGGFDFAGRTFQMDTNNSYVFIDIDRAGNVRAATRIPSKGFAPVPKAAFVGDTDVVRPEFSFESPGHYRTHVYLGTNSQLSGIILTSPTNRYYIANLNVPEPDPATPAQPSFTRILTNNESITLTGSPDLPGLVLYQWLRDGVPIPKATAHDLTLTSFSFSDAGQYSLAIRNAHGSATNPIAVLNYTGPPALAIDSAPASNKLLLRWPLSASNYRLQSTTNVAAVFTTVLDVPATNTPLSRLELPITPPLVPTFFRLITSQ